MAKRLSMGRIAIIIMECIVGYTNSTVYSCALLRDISAYDVYITLDVQSYGITINARGKAVQQDVVELRFVCS